MKVFSVAMDTMFPELLYIIIGFIDGPSLFNVSTVSKIFHDLALTHITEINDYWDFARVCDKGDTLSVIHGNFRKWAVECKYTKGNKYPDKTTSDSAAYIFNYEMYRACKNGYSLLVQILKTRATIFTWSLWGACVGGYISLVRSILQEHHFEESVLDEGLCNACKNGYCDISDLMITEGATYCEHCGTSSSSHKIIHSIHLSMGGL